MRRLKNTAIRQAKEFLGRFSRTQLPTWYMHEQVPYYAQWESRDLVEAIVTGEITAGEDPIWKQSGAESIAEYIAWSWNSCGMACLRMILAREGKDISIVKLAKQCLSYGGYRLPLKDSPGLFYQPFVRFIREEYGLQGTSTATLTMRELKGHLAQGRYVLASVSPAIRDLAGRPIQKGGHLVLVLGYNDEKQLLYLHNPSGFTEATQEYAEVPYHVFPHYFAGKGIVVVSY